jgi:hypothetical protein
VAIFHSQSSWQDYCWCHIIERRRSLGSWTIKWLMSCRPSDPCHLLYYETRNVIDIVYLSLGSLIRVWESFRQWRMTDQFLLFYFLSSGVILFRCSLCMHGESAQGGLHNRKFAEGFSLLIKHREFVSLSTLLSSFMLDQTKGFLISIKRHQH